MTHTIDHAIVDVLVVKDGQYLLVQESKPGREGTYNLPGGHVEAHETLFEAAVRETKEETGYDVELTGLVGIYQTVYARLNISGPTFCARVIGGQATATPEHPEVRWATRDELESLAEAGRLFTHYPPYAIAHYEERGALPLDAVYAHRHVSS